MTGQRLMTIMSGDDRTAAGGAARLGLGLLEPAYRVGVQMRNIMFDSGLRKSRSLGRPVISVGNLTTGGTGKTPMVIELARRLTRWGVRPAIVLRGYKSGGAISDETALLTESLGDKVPVAADADRFAAATRLTQRHPDLDVIILDDGFQHRQMSRDLDIVLIDATEPFGYEHLLPRGLLREPQRNLRRAARVVVTRADLIDQAHRSTLDLRIAAMTGHRPLAHAAYRWKTLLDDENEQHPVDHLKGQTVLGVCGIGNPKAFAQNMTAHVGPGAHIERFADHYDYTPADAQHILSQAKSISATALLATEKDWVKLRRLLKNAPIRTYRPVLRVEFMSGDEQINELVRGVVSSATVR